MPYLLFEDATAEALLPLTYTRPVYALRVGILTIKEKWAKQLGIDTAKLGCHTRQYLMPSFGHIEANETYHCFNGKFLPTLRLTQALLPRIGQGKAFVTPKGDVLAFTATGRQLQSIRGVVDRAVVQQFAVLETLRLEPLEAINSLPDIFMLNSQAISDDLALLAPPQTEVEKLDRHSIAYNPEQIWIDPTVNLKAAVLNAESGPIYLGPNVEVQPGAVIYGPVAVLEGSTINIGAKIKGGTTIGPHCKVGGEVAMSVLQGYSNKGHDGFLGHSVIGHWCNLGADTNTSNLKNTYRTVQLYNYPVHRPIDTGLTFCGTIMGDHAKTGINTMLNTGTVLGVATNVFGGGFPPKFTPSFTWWDGDQKHLIPYRIHGFFETAEKVLARRGVAFTEADRQLLEAVHQLALENKG